jgi:NADPH:quinone reductase-like Zn-dependent oxidoreductase
MKEREHILQSLKETLRHIPAVAVVTRNRRKASTLREMVALCIMDMGDEVAEDTTGPIVKRRMRVGVDMVFQGTTEEKAPQEIAALQDDIRRAVYGPTLSRTIGTTYKGHIFESGISALDFPRDASAKLVSQEIQFEVLYVQDLRRLYS